MRKINLDGFKLITEFEGCRLKVYRDIVGVLTIGYGHTGGDVHEGMIITQKTADILLESDLTKFEEGVEKLIKGNVNDNQFSALVCFAYNVGLAELAHSQLLRYINNSAFEHAAGEFLKWDHAGGQVIPGLKRRRQVEHDLFIS